MEVFGTRQEQDLKRFEEGSIGEPEDKPLPFGKEPVPHILLGDDAFALQPFVMKPYPKKGLDLGEMNLQLQVREENICC